MKLPLDNSADPFKVGRDQRTPYKIALAAGHIEVVNLLRAAEARVGGGKTSRSDRKYTRAYHLGELRKFNDWLEALSGDGNADPASNGDRALSDDDVVYLHEDLSVTQSTWHTVQGVFNRVTPEWKDFCVNVLGFRVLEDFEFCISAG